VLISAADRTGVTYLEHRDGCGSIPEPCQPIPRWRREPPWPATSASSYRTTASRA
jgi:hypothetical protein